MTNFYGTAIKKPIPVKWYDLTKCPRDDDGDYLDEKGEKLTYAKYIQETEDETIEYPLDPNISEEEMNDIDAYKVHFVSTLENKQDKIHDDGFILVGIKGEKWCVRRDIFLETYDIEETK